MAVPDYLQPFVLSDVVSIPQRQGSLDVYRPDSIQGGPFPAIIFVHGGPIPADLRPTPRDWPVYVGYGSLAARSGVVGVTLDHRLHDSGDYLLAAADVTAAVEHARNLSDVDEDRVAVWFFSGGGLLATDWLASPPSWLRCIAVTYPVLAPLPGRDIDPRFRPAEALRGAADLPILLTRVGRERSEIATTVEEFVVAAAVQRVHLEVIDVPDGQHGFDMLDHNEDSRQAVMRAMTWVTTTLLTT